jgi:hypothetical protein
MPEFKCPACHSIIYSRKNKICGQCGAELPKELLLSDKQLQIFEKERRSAEQRARNANSWRDASGPDFLSSTDFS